MSQNEKDKILGAELDEDQLRQVSGGGWDADQYNCHEDHYWPLTRSGACSATVGRNPSGMPTGMCGTNDCCSYNAVVYMRVPGKFCAATVEDGSDCSCTDACSNLQVRYWKCYMDDI